MNGSMTVEKKRTETIMPSCCVCGNECEEVVILSASESSIDPESVDICKDCLLKALKLLEGEA